MRQLIILLGLITCSLASFGQKIKYKDLFFLLDTEKYDVAEPLLRTYLSDPKNADEANPNLQMAFIFQKKADESDILLETDKFVSYADSALIYYTKATTYLDEKEVKKNDEYYQAYQRRDIRTGKFGIKLADVLFDIENKVKGLKDKKASVQELDIYYDKTLTNYDAALEEFKKIKSDYPSEKILYLRSNQDLLDRIEKVETSAKLALQNYESFESTLKKIDKPGYAPALHMKDILEYQKDGESAIDLTADNIDFWDYPKWGESVRKGVKEVVNPMRSEMVEYDQHLNALIDRMLVDSMAVDDRIQPFQTLLGKIREYDSDPLPEYVFKYKIADIKMESYQMNNLYYRDSADVIYQLEVAQTKYDYIHEMDSLVNLLLSRNMKEDQLNYAYFVDTQYKDIAGLETYIKNQLDKVLYAKKGIDEEVALLEERSRWLVGENDSVPLFTDVNIGLSKYVPLMLEENFTAGMYFSGKGPAQGYFAEINNARSQKLKVNFELDTKHFNKQNLELTRAMETIEDEGHYYYVLFYVQLPEVEEYAATVAKIYTSDGLAWAKNITLATAPKELVINTNTSDLIIEYDLVNYLGSEEIDDRLVLTKQGAIK